MRELLHVLAFVLGVLMAYFLIRAGIFVYLRRGADEQYSTYLNSRIRGYLIWSSLCVLVEGLLVTAYYVWF